MRSALETKLTLRSPDLRYTAYCTGPLVQLHLRDADKTLLTVIQSRNTLCPLFYSLLYNLFLSFVFLYCIPYYCFVFFISTLFFFILFLYYIPFSCIFVFYSVFMYCFPYFYIVFHILLLCLHTLTLFSIFLDYIPFSCIVFPIFVLYSIFLY